MTQRKQVPEIHLEMRVEKPTVANGGYGHVYLDPFRFEDGEKRYFVTGYFDHPLHLQNLRVVSQIDGRGDNDSYGWGIEYRSIYSLGSVSEANDIAATLRALDRKMQRMNEKEGRAQSFGQYVNRAMRALGAKSVHYTTTAARERDAGLTQTWKPGEVAYIVDQAVSELREEAVKMVEGGLVR